MTTPPLPPDEIPAGVGLIIVCRYRADRDLTGRARPGEVERACNVCGAAILVTPRGAEQQLACAAAFVVCHPCGQMLARRVANAGKPVHLTSNPMAAESIRASAGARAELEKMRRAIRDPS